MKQITLMVAESGTGVFYSYGIHDLIKMIKKRITLKHIARKFDVSIAAVSKALNDSYEISVKTKENLLVLSAYFVEPLISFVIICQKLLQPSVGKRMI